MGIKLQTRFKKFKTKRHLLWPVLIILFILNIVLIGITVRTLINKNSGDINQLSQPNYSDFYDQPCPDIEMMNIQGEDIKLTDFIGNIIIIHFTEFLYRDFPNLLYLEHLYKYSQGNTKLFFVYPTKNRFSAIINDFNLLFVPIIEDDGSIAAVFNAAQNDTIIIGKDFTIKFKSSLFRKYTIYNQIKKLHGENFPNAPIQKEDLSTFLKTINYRNIKSDKTENLGTIMIDKCSLVNIFISTCLDCPENKRIYLLNETAYEARLDKRQIVILFGFGNNFEMVKEFCEKNNLRNMTIGIIQDSGQLPQNDYYKIFKFNIDPRLFIFDGDGNLTFAEDIKNRRKISPDLIMKQLSRS